MSVYFIRVGQYVKVGFSDDPQRRFRRLFNGATGYSAPWDCPRALADRELLGFIPGDKADERAAHEALNDFSVGCEFYLAEQPVLDYVTRCLGMDDVAIDPVVRASGPAPFADQVPPGSHVNSLADLTAARRAAS